MVLFLEILSQRSHAVDNFHCSAICQHRLFDRWWDQQWRVFTTTSPQNNGHFVFILHDHIYQKKSFGEGSFVGLRICWLYILKSGVRAPPLTHTCSQRGVLGITLHLLVWFQFWGVWSILLLPLLPGPLWLGVIVLVWVPSIDQIDMFKNYLYLFRILDTI